MLSAAERAASEKMTVLVVEPMKEPYVKEIDPIKDIAVLAPIGLDHQQYLGDTLEEIAAEKAAIIAPGKPSVTAMQHPGVMAVIERTAQNRRSPLTIARADRKTPIPSLPGAHQRENAALALETMRRLHSLPSPSEAAAVLAKVQWPGRFERLETPPLGVGRRS